MEMKERPWLTWVQRLQNPTSPAFLVATVTRKDSVRSAPLVARDQVVAGTTTMGGIEKEDVALLALLTKSHEAIMTLAAAIMSPVVLVKTQAGLTVNLLGHRMADQALKM